MNEFTIKLRDLKKLAEYETIKVISSDSGKVLIHNYSEKKHEHLGDLEVTGIFTEIEVCGSRYDKNVARSKLVCWASEWQYKELKEAAENTKKESS